MDAGLETFAEHGCVIVYIHDLMHLKQVNEYLHVGEGPLMAQMFLKHGAVVCVLPLHPCFLPHFFSLKLCAVDQHFP